MLEQRLLILRYKKAQKDLYTMVMLYGDIRQKFKKGTLTKEDIEYHNIILQSLNIRKKFRNGGDNEKTKRT